jgi:hypothetical protein
MSREDAFSLHQKNESYTAIISDVKGVPTHLISVANNIYLVIFLNKSGQVFLSYQFDVVGEKMFLTFANHHEYHEVTGKEVEVSTYAFKQDGSLYIEKRDRINSEILNSTTQTDVHKNWESIPPFGEYSNLLIEER